MEEQTLSFVRRDTVNFYVTVKDNNGEIFDLTGYIALFTGKRKPTEADDCAIIKPVYGTITEPSSGIINFYLSSEHTNIPSGTYFFDVQINNNDLTDVKTVAMGKIIVTQDITFEFGGN
jgi:hypothetical protein